MSTTAITQETGIGIDALESILVEGNLEKLSPAQRLDYYAATCKSLGLNPLTKPFAYIKLSGKTTLYALKETTDQLRKIHGISVRITDREEIGESYVVTAFATDRDGRTDESTGAVPMGGLRGDAHSNALMKAETKAKRRVTLSIAGLGMLDETEIDTIPNAQANVVDLDTGEFIDPAPPVSKPARTARTAPKSEVVVIPAETVEEIIDSTVTMIAEANEAQDDDTVEDDDEDTFVAVTHSAPPNCTKQNHGDGIYTVQMNPNTGERRWVHQFTYELNGKSRTGNCLDDSGTALPPKSSD